MANRIDVGSHVDTKLFREWEPSQTSSSERQYVSEVARFLRSHPHKRLRSIDHYAIAMYLDSLAPSVSARTKTALNHFFQFLLERRAVDANPLDRLVHRRKVEVSNLQMSLFAQLREEGLKPGDIRKLVWRDFLGPILASPKAARIQVSGRLVQLRPALWKSLEKRFKGLAAQTDLRSLLRQKIAS